jgi:hypothetical protein
VLHSKGNLKRTSDEGKIEGRVKAEKEVSVVYCVVSVSYKCRNGL